MHDGSRVTTWFDLHAFDAFCFGQSGRDVVLVPHVIATCRNVDRDRCNDQIGLAKLRLEIPGVSVGDVRHRRNDINRSQRRTLVYPGYDCFYFFLGHSPVAFQVLDTDVLIVGIRRHFPIGYA